MRLTLADLEALIEQAQEEAEFAEDDHIEQGLGMVSGPASILNFFDIQTGDAFDIAPDDAISLFKAKGLKPTFSYADMLGKAHVQSFTVAKMMDVDLLGQVRTSMESSLANGTPFKEWSDGLIPMLQGAGWWGRKEVIDPLTGQTVIAQLGSPHRLETIFRTNMQTAYAQQQWEMIDSQKDVAPYLLYDAVDDHRTRPSHKARDNTILPVDHPWWDKNTPPLGYGCRCGVIQLSKDELDALGKLPNTKPPALGDYEWTNPRTGQKVTLQEGIDPGFDFNPGKTGIQQKLENLLAEKIQMLPPDMQKAANNSLEDGNAAQNAYNAAITKAMNKPTRTERKASAAAAATIAAASVAEGNIAAEKVLSAIEKGRGEFSMSILRIALRELEQTEEFRAMQPIDRLGAVYQRAKELAAG
jgi:SPP1 gp7 family putative phage head morphogenesis protein